MRAISMKCPNCGARLETNETAHTVSCKYCGTQSRVQHRTRILERKIELPPPRPAQRRMPVAKQKHGMGWIVFVSTLMPLFIGGAIFYTTMKRTGGFSKISGALTGVTDTVIGDLMQYSGSGNALLFDVNGDGESDVIGTVRYVQNNDSHHVAAFDGLSGEQLWESETFGTHDDAISGTMALHGGTVVQSDSRGNISGFSAKSGERLFKVSLGEKLKSLCADGTSSLAVHLADKTWKSMDLATGAFTKLDDEPAGCAQIPSDSEHGQIDTEYSNDHRRGHHKLKVHVEGMQVRTTVALLNQPGRYIALGHKVPGTRIPMLAAFHDAEMDVTAEAPDPAGEKRRKSKRKKKSHGPKYVVDWSSDLPGLDPLGVREGAPELVAANQQCVASLYEPKSRNPRLVCFNPVSGIRLWDTPLPKRTTYVIRALDITDKRVYVSQWGELDAFEISDGRRIFTIGD